jgi:hypothetical protein
VSKKNTHLAIAFVAGGFLFAPAWNMIRGFVKKA